MQPGSSMYIADMLIFRTRVKLIWINRSKMLIWCIIYRWQNLDFAKFKTKLVYFNMLFLSDDQTHALLAKPYFDIRDKMSVQDGIMSWRTDCNSKSYPNQLMQHIHSLHIGIGGCIRPTKECMYWPGMHAKIPNYVLNCETCQMFESKQQKETLKPYELIRKIRYSRYGYVSRTAYRNSAAVNSPVTVL